jgi:hypothetical protein
MMRKLDALSSRQQVSTARSAQIVDGAGSQGACTKKQARSPSKSTATSRLRTSQFYLGSCRSVALDSAHDKPHGDGRRTCHGT